MQFQTKRAELLSALKTLLLCTPEKPVMTQTSGLLFEVTATEATITATNLTYSARIKLPVTCDAGIRVIIPARRMLDVVSAMSGDQIVVTAQGWRSFVEITDGEFKVKLSTIAGDMPSTTLDDAYFKMCTADGAWLSEAINAVKFAMPANAEAYPHLMGILLDVHDHKLTVAAGSGVVIAAKTGEVGSRSDNRKVLPIQAAVILARILSQVGACEIAVNDGRMKVVSTGLECSLPLSALAYPDIMKMFAGLETTQQSAKVELERIKTAIRRVNLIRSTETREQLYATLGFKPNVLEIDATSSVGEVHDKLPCELTGSSFDVKYNVKYLFAGLCGGSDESITLGLNTPVTPTIWTSGDFKMLLMPVDDSKAAQA